MAKLASKIHVVEIVKITRVTESISGSVVRPNLHAEIYIVDREKPKILEDDQIE